MLQTTRSVLNQGKSFSPLHYPSSQALFVNCNVVCAANTLQYQDASFFAACSMYVWMPSGCRMCPSALMCPYVFVCRMCPSGCRMCPSYQCSMCIWHQRRPCILGAFGVNTSFLCRVPGLCMNTSFMCRVSDLLPLPCMAERQPGTSVLPVYWSLPVLTHPARLLGCRLLTVLPDQAGGI